MPGERSVRISLEAREELSRAVQQIDTALDRLKGSLATVSGAMAGSDASAENLEGSLDEIGDEATQASVKLSTLTGSLAGFNMVPLEDKDLDLDVDEEGLEKIRKGEFTVRDAMDNIVDKDKEFRKRRFFKMPGAPDFKRRSKELNEIFDRFQPNVKLDLDPSEAIAEAPAATKEIEGAVSDAKVGVDLDLDEAFDEMSTLRSMIETFEKGTSVKLGVDLDLDEAFGELTKLRAMIETFEKGADIDVGIDIEASDDVVELATLIATMSGVQASAFKTAASTRAAAGGIDEMGDEAAESAAEMTALQSVASLLSLNTTALSLNVGAFNIALSQLATQIPILISLLGTLATVIMGVVGAAGLAATGFAGIVAGGFVAELERVADEFENIENRAEALQAIMQSLIPAFIDAFQPLIDVGGEADMFFGVINNLLETVNVFSKAIADSFEFSGQQMEEFITISESMGLVGNEIMSLSEFFDEMGRIWQENAGDIIAATQVMSAFLLPVLADIIEFFIAGFDDMTLFITKFTNELAVIGPALSGLIDFAVQLVDLGSTIIQGVLPIVVGLLGVGTELASMFNSLNPAVVRNVAGIATLAIVVSRAVGAYQSLAENIGEVIAGTQLQVLWRGILSNALAVYRGQLAATTALQRVSNLTRSSAIGLLRTHTLGKFALAAASKAQAAAQWLANTALGSFIVAAWGAVASLGSLVLGKLAAAAATLGLAGAYATLSAATGGLLTAVGALATALIALVGVAAVGVGALANTEKVTSGLGATLAVLKTVLVAIGDVLLGTLINVWNSLATAFEGVMLVVDSLTSGFGRIAEALGLVSGEGSMLTAIWDGLLTALDIILAPIEVLYNILGNLAFIIGGVLAGAINIIVGYLVFVINYWKTLIGLVGSAINWLLDFAGVSGDVGDGIDAITAAVGGLIGFLKSLPSIAGSVFGAVVSWIEDAANRVIDVINEMINAIPSSVRSRLGISTIGEFDLQGPTGAGDISRSDVIGGGGGGGDATDEMEGQRANEFNYNEENVNNVAQDINADPEDKESLKRVVKDAMEEANSFTRRQQGGM